MLWYSNNIGNKIDEIYLYMNTKEIDILAGNETKLDKENESFCFNNNQFNYHLKSRNKYGGGVGFVIRKYIEFEIIIDLDRFKTEAVCVKIKNNKKDLYLITYYNPPNSKINMEIFEFIEKNYEHYIICGDLNSKHKSFGCKINNINGNDLNEFLSKSNSVLLNNTYEFTYFREFN